MHGSWRAANEATEARVGLGTAACFSGRSRWAGPPFDLVTKSIVFSRLGPPPARRSVRSSRTFWSCTPVRTRVRSGVLEPGIPCSSLIFAGLSVVAAIVICYYLFVLGAAASRVLTIALGLIMAGALGNCYDRLVFGYVRDFVHFHVDAIGFDCAIFNFADNMLVAGAITLVLYALRPEQSPADRQPSPCARHVHAGAARSRSSPSESRKIPRGL